MERPTRAQRAASFLSASLALVLLATILPSTVAGAATTDGLCPADYSRPSSTPPVSTEESPEGSLAPVASPLTTSPRSPPVSIRLGGTWRELPRSPFSAANATAVWAGDRMVVINHRRGRTATYYPLTGRWEEHQRVPGKSPAGGTFDGAPDAVWTGDEVIVFGGRTGRDTDWVTWYAFDPARGRWRDVPASPLEQRGLATAWTGDLLLVVGRDRTAAAYDPAADCWLEMPDLPLPELPDNARTWRAMEWEVRSLHWTGDELLAEVSAEQQRVPIGIVSFDPRAWTWDPGPQAPSSSRLSSPILADGRLWFMFEDALDDYIVDATYDPGLKLWEAVDIDCPISSWGTVWTGRLIMEPMWNRHAYDPTTGECFRTPRVKDRARTSGGTVWTGREFIVWSGAWGDSGRAFPDGLVYRPPRSAIDRREVGAVQQEAAASDSDAPRVRVRRRSGRRARDHG